MACDPAVLIDQAKCINACIPQGMMPSVNTYLLCRIASAVFPSNGLIHYWKLEEAAGSARKDAIGISDLSEFNGIISSAIGKHANAASYPGAGAYLNGTPFVLGPPWSISLWVNMSQFDRDVFELFDGSLVGPYLSVTLAGVLEAGNATDGTVVTAPLGSLNVWHLIVLTVLANGTYSLSVDGSVFVVAVAPSPPNNSTQLQLGTAQSIGRGSLIGLIDEVAIFSRAISQVDVAIIWNGGNGTFL
jgi:hypothetical protein